MPARDPMTFPKGMVKMANLRETLVGSQKKPSISYTQGGSSRRYHGSKVAGIVAQVNPKKKPKGVF